MAIYNEMQPGSLEWRVASYLSRKHRVILYYGNYSFQEAVNAIIREVPDKEIDIRQDVRYFTEHGEALLALEWLE